MYGKGQDEPTTDEYDNYDYFGNDSSYTADPHTSDYYVNPKIEYDDDEMIATDSEGD